MKTLKMSPRQLSISLISYLKMTSQGEVKDCLNWPLEWKIFSHRVRILFPFIWGRWKDSRDLLAVSSGEGEQSILGCKVLYAVQIQRGFDFSLCPFIWKKLYESDQNVVDIRRSLWNTIAAQRTGSSYNKFSVLVYLRPCLWSYLVWKEFAFP